MKNAEKISMPSKSKTKQPRAPVNTEHALSECRSKSKTGFFANAKTIPERNQPLEKTLNEFPTELGNDQTSNLKDRNASSTRLHDFNSLTMIFTLTFAAFAIVIIGLFIFHKAKQENELENFLSQNYSIMTEKYTNLALSMSEAVRSEVYYMESVVLNFISYLNINPNFLSPKRSNGTTTSTITQSYGPNLILTSTGSENSTSLLKNQKLTCSDTNIQTCYGFLFTDANGTTSVSSNSTLKANDSMPIVASNWYHIFDKNFAVISNKNDYFIKLNMTQISSFSDRVSKFMTKYLSSVQDEYKTFNYLGLLDSFYNSANDKSPIAYSYFLAPSIYTNNSFFNASSLFVSNSTVHVQDSEIVSFVIQVDRYSILTREISLWLESDQTISKIAFP
jgi:hypothetical protein